MKNTDKTGRKFSGFVQFEEQAKDNRADRGEQTVQAGTVFNEKMAKLFGNGKDTVSVSTVDQFACHGSCAFSGI